MKAILLLSLLLFSFQSLADTTQNKIYNVVFRSTSPELIPHKFIEAQNIKKALKKANMWLANCKNPDRNRNRPKDCPKHIPHDVTFDIDLTKLKKHSVYLKMKNGKHCALQGEILAESPHTALYGKFLPRLKDKKNNSKGCPDGEVISATAYPTNDASKKLDKIKNKSSVNFEKTSVKVTTHANKMAAAANKDFSKLLKDLETARHQFGNPNNIPFSKIGDIYDPANYQELETPASN